MPRIIQMDNEQTETGAKIKVIGVGGAGGNAVNRMVRSGFTGVEFIAVNTDQMALDNSLADLKIAIGSKLTRGLGAGAKPDVGRAAIEEDREAVRQALEGSDMVFITAGMGGGTGTGAAPVVAEIAREMNILSVGVVTRPFLFEGPVRSRNCKGGLDLLKKEVDTIIVIQNQKILSIADKNTGFQEAFAMADGVLTNAVRGISEIILEHGEIQVDFADVRAIMEDGGEALMGTGFAEGEGRALEAAKKAIDSPLLDDVDIAGASGLLVNICGGEDLGIFEVNEAMNYIYEAVGEENSPNIIFGTVINREFSNKLSVTVIATGFNKVSTPEPVRQSEVASNMQQPVPQPRVEAKPQVSATVPPTASIEQPKQANSEFVAPVNPQSFEQRGGDDYSIRNSQEQAYPYKEMPSEPCVTTERESMISADKYEAEFSDQSFDVTQMQAKEWELPVQRKEEKVMVSQEKSRVTVESTDSAANYDWDTPAFLRNED
jgi:cell division protein FtsZ